ncbi:MAG: hypothetical protein WCM76_16110 [Bacteroidota bacterium]
MKLLHVNMVRYFLLVLFLAYYGSITLFIHTHVNNGVTIVHSHPFISTTAKNPEKNRHSTNGLILIASLSQFVSSAASPAFSIGFEAIYLLSAVFLRGEQHFAMSCYHYSRGLRAPPLSYSV